MSNIHTSKDALELDYDRSHLLHSIPLHPVKSAVPENVNTLTASIGNLISNLTLSIRYPLIFISGDSATGKSTLAASLIESFLSQSDWNVAVVRTELGGPIVDDGHLAVSERYRTRISYAYTVDDLMDQFRFSKCLLLLDDVIHDIDSSVLSHDTPMIITASGLRHLDRRIVDSIFNRASVWISNHSYSEYDPREFLNYIHGECGISYRGGIERRYINAHNALRLNGNRKGRFICVNRHTNDVDVIRISPQHEFTDIA